MTDYWILNHGIVVVVVIVVVTTGKLVNLFECTGNSHIVVVVRSGGRS